MRPSTCRKHVRYVHRVLVRVGGHVPLHAQELGLNVIVSNPYMTLLIAKSKKTDKVDAAAVG